MHLRYDCRLGWSCHRSGGSSNLSRIQQVFDAAAETGRRVVLTGFDVENIVRTAIRLNKLSLANEKLLIKPKEMSRFEDHELIILETGRMGEPINGLRKMSIAVTVMWKSKMGTWSTLSQHHLLLKKLWWLVWKT